MARSGTSYFGELLNSHRQILCGHERFSPGKLKADYFTPQGFLECEPSRVDRRRMEALLASKGELVAIGDKFPRGYMQTGNLVAQIPGAQFFAIIRDVRQVGASWNARAKNPTDSWPAGMVSLFADIEFLFLIFALFTLPPEIDVRLVNYRYLVSPESMDDCATNLCGLLGLEPDESMREFVRASRSYRRPPSGKPAAIDEEFYSLPFVRQFLTNVEGWKIESRTEKLRDIRTFIAGFRNSESAVTEIFAEAMKASFASNPATREYVLRIRALYRQAAKSMRLLRFTRELLQAAQS
ncbi:MAG TPA: hypothetical protein VGG69_11995 [Rhizomicrobium sp.]